MSAGDTSPGQLPRGLPGPLPRGERILWQGAPAALGTTMRIFHAQVVAGWFALVALVLGAEAAVNGSMVKAVAVVSPTLLIGTGAIGLLTLFGWLVHRTTVYTITDRRVVLQIGIAAPVTLNLPFAQIEAARFCGFTDGSGDIPLVLRDGQRVAYLHLWPHARPWCFIRPEPMLRSVPDAQAVASLLARALAVYAGREEAAPVVAAPPRAAEPAGVLVAAGMR